MQKVRNRKLIMCSASLLAVKLITIAPPKYHKYATTIQNIRDLIEQPWEIQIHHTLREGNFAADFMAKIGADSRDALQIFHHPQQKLQKP